VDGRKDTYWATDDGVTSASLEVNLGAETELNVIRTEEVIQLGQRVQEYKVEIWNDASGAWNSIVQGTTIGHCKLDRFPRVKTSKLRLTIVKALACPTIRSFGAFLDTVSPPESFEPAKALFEFKPRTSR
jgi:alpha-L-fucosidase